VSYEQLYRECCEAAKSLAGDATHCLGGSACTTTSQRAQPLAWWSAQDTWAYLFSREVPYHPLYDRETHGQTRETLRNTGWLSTDGAEQGRIAWLREHYPDQYRLLEAAFPRIRQLR
jgi:3'-phosphoadenosine 5'-phosphosulfate sulfotransferase (PAPS reductase)/FAD synthetase